jgi:hypothetical protein
MLSLLFSAGTVNGQVTPTEGIVIASPGQDEHWQVSTQHEIRWEAGSLFDFFRPSRVSIALLDQRQQRIVMMIANIRNRGKYSEHSSTVSAAKYRIGVIRTPDSKYGISKLFYITDCHQLNLPHAPQEQILMTFVERVKTPQLVKGAALTTCFPTGSA